MDNGATVHQSVGRFQASGDGLKRLAWLVQNVRAVTLMDVIGGSVLLPFTFVLGHQGRPERQVRTNSENRQVSPIPSPVGNTGYLAGPRDATEFYPLHRPSAKGVLGIIGRLYSYILVFFGIIDTLLHLPFHFRCVIPVLLFFTIPHRVYFHDYFPSPSSISTRRPVILIIVPTAFPHSLSSSSSFSPPLPAVNYISPSSSDLLTTGNRVNPFRNVLRLANTLPPIKISAFGPRWRPDGNLTHSEPAKSILPHITLLLALLAPATRLEHSQSFDLHIPLQLHQNQYRGL